jgi:hypothetical protein
MPRLRVLSDENETLVGDYAVFRIRIRGTRGPSSDSQRRPPVLRTVPGPGGVDRVAGRGATKRPQH